MLSLMLSLWDDFSEWVSLRWTKTTFILVVGALAILGVMGLLTFLKKSKLDKEKKNLKWSGIVVSVVMFAILAVLCAARFV